MKVIGRSHIPRETPSPFAREIDRIPWEHNSFQQNTCTEFMKRTTRSKRHVKGANEVKLMAKMSNRLTSD